MAKVKQISEGVYRLKCPAGHEHDIPTVARNGRPKWSFNGNLESPTFNPSIDEKTGYFVDPNTEGDEEWLKANSYRCHFFIKDGQIVFCGDCSHNLKGQTITLQDII